MKNIVFTFLLLLFCNLICSQSTEDKKYSKQKTKIENLLKSKKYYKLFKYSNTVLIDYPKDNYFHFANAYGLFYSSENKKIKKVFNEARLWIELFEQLKKSKPIDKFDTKFSRDIQKELNSKVNAFLKNNEFKKSVHNLNFLFSFFDNSSSDYNNLFSESIQDTLFNMAKKLYLTDKENAADEIFNWLFKTFYGKKFIYKYNGSEGYVDSVYSFIEYKNPKFCLANTAINVTYLTKEEKQLIYLHNILHMNPPLFCKTYVAKYFSINTYSSNSEYAKSLVKDLNNTNKITLLNPNASLSKASSFHATDMGKTGNIGHNSSDGTDFSARIRKFGTNDYSTIGENCSYGFNNPFEILMQLLIDEGVTSKGHRKNILKDSYTEIGVAIHEHSNYGYNSVIDFKR